MSKEPFTLDAYGITTATILRNAVPAKLYAEALRYEPDAAVSEQGALIVKSYAKTGRSPKDKRIVEGEASSWSLPGRTNSRPGSSPASSIARVP